MSALLHANAPPCLVSLDTSACFDRAHTGRKVSAIDHFFENHRHINQIATPDNLKAHPVLGGLAVLGSVSAVESYFREMIRRTILLDPQSAEESNSRPLSYGATRVHKREMLPEALLEDCSFAGSRTIGLALKDFLGLPNQQPADVKASLESFDKLCQFRHCVVHRFGKLGSRNALLLGLDSHSACVEKPLLVNYSQLQDVFGISYNAVKSTNSFVFTELLRRTAKANVWHWDYRRDKSRFLRYWQLFASKEEPPARPRTVREAYGIFSKTFK